MTLPDGTAKIGMIIAAEVTRPAPFGLFCRSGEHHLLIRVTQISWTALPELSCADFAPPGTTLTARIIEVAGGGRIYASVRAAYPESNPWGGGWPIAVGALLPARVLRPVILNGAGEAMAGHLLELRPGTYATIPEAGEAVAPGDMCQVMVTRFDPSRRRLTVTLAAPATDQDTR